MGRLICAMKSSMPKLINKLNDMNVNKPAFFITGTDTDCGKTRVSAALIRHLRGSNQRVAGLKPIASGFELSSGEWKNTDVETLKSASNVVLGSEQVNRYAYRSAIAPHIAAERAGQAIDSDLIARDVEHALNQVDALVVEAVGGWLVPLNSQGIGDPDAESIETLAKKLNLPVVLVVGMTLGCLNHALLTANAIVESGVPFAGWVANYIDPNFECVRDNISTLGRKMPVPKLFELPYIENSVEFGELRAFSDHWHSLCEKAF